MTEAYTPDEFLAARRRELVTRAEDKGIDWEAQIRDLPKDDEALIVVALATLLELDIQNVLDQDRTLDELERDRDLLLREQQVLNEVSFREQLRG